MLQCRKTGIAKSRGDGGRSSRLYGGGNSSEQGDIHREVLLNPVLFELLGDVDGQKYLMLVVERY